ncbi:restriction endonuclease [Streptomyces sp. NPDC046324]|uniref:restriction endonuclease n=1 Tax=Streptomyces sp. NPDC046324 TaxID=3154915 RepID=UPI0033D28C4D
MSIAKKITTRSQVSMYFRHPGYVSGFVQLRPEAEQDLAKLSKARREAWEAAMEAAEKDILHDTVELTCEERRGTYDPKWQSWKMPVDLGIGISAVEDGVATVRLVQRRIAGFETIYQVVSYLNGANIRHQVTVGEIVATGEKSRIRASLPQQKTAAAPGDAAYSFGAYLRLLGEVEASCHELVAKYRTVDGEQREESYQDLRQLAAFLAGQASLLEEKAAASSAKPKPRFRAVKDWFDLTSSEFEQAIADLCREGGCYRVEVPGGAGDLGADVIAYTPEGRKVVIQCKQYRGKVGSPEMQKFAGTVFSVHQADIALMVTTGLVTGPAADYASVIGIRIVDSNVLRRWADGTDRPPWK